MHDRFSTRGGHFGFVALLADGRIMREDQVTWDEVPADVAIASLAIVHLRLGHKYVSLEGFGRYFFSNQAGQSAIGPMIHTGKLVGAVRKNGGGATEIFIDFDGVLPRVRQREYPPAEIPFAPSALRQGV
jgi:hypothetical protein